MIAIVHITLSHCYPHFFAHLVFHSNPQWDAQFNSRRHIQLPSHPAPKLTPNLVFLLYPVTLKFYPKLMSFKMSDYGGFDLNMSMDRFKSNQTLHFWLFFDILYFIVGNPRVIHDLAMKIHSFRIECDSKMRVTFL